MLGKSELIARKLKGLIMVFSNDFWKLFAKSRNPMRENNERNAGVHEKKAFDVGHFFNS